MPNLSFIVLDAVVNSNIVEKNTSWLRISIQEGKNRQVRKMTAKVGFPTLRLIRTHIELLDLGGLQPSEYRQMDKKQVYYKLKLDG